MERLTVTAHFHTAHRQLNFPGHCRNVHGHTWRGRIRVECEEFPRDEIDVSLDFGALKGLMRRYDHKIIVTPDDADFLNPALFDQEGVYVIPGRGPSVENVAIDIFRGVIELITAQYPGRGIRYQVAVSLQETDNNHFELEREVTI